MNCGLPVVASSMLAMHMNECQQLLIPMPCQTTFSLLQLACLCHLWDPQACPESPQTVACSHSLPALVVLLHNATLPEAAVLLACRASSWDHSRWQGTVAGRW